MHIDFCFADPQGRGLIAGWSPEPDPRLALMVGGCRVPVAAVSRFPRRDLGGRGSQG